MTQYVDGLLGPFVIHNPNEVYGSDYADESVLFLQDWYHPYSSSMLWKKKEVRINSLQIYFNTTCPLIVKGTNQTQILL
jgi:FtsP/CotA-like multicopper oxidase with cupredoxin domain